MAELPRAVRYAWAPAERVLVIAAWLDTAGRSGAIIEWASAGHGVGTDVADDPGSN